MPTDTIVKTGFSELDEKFGSGGFPLGNICVLESDPKSPVISVLYQMYQNATPEAGIIAPMRSEQKLHSDLRELNMNPDLINSTFAHDEVSKLSCVIDVLERVEESDTMDFIVVNSIEHLRHDMDYTNFFAKIGDIAVDQNQVILLHLGGNRHGEQSDIRLAGLHAADIILTLSHRVGKSSINHRITINRLPAGEGVRDMYEDERTMEMSDTNERVDISTGGYI